MTHDLTQVDLIRERMGVGYAQAKEALDEAGGDLIAALAAVEERQAEAAKPDSFEQIVQTITQEVKASLSGRSIERVDVVVGDQTVKQLPVALVGLGAVLLLVLSALLTYLRLDLVTSDEKADSPTPQITEHGQA